MAHKIFSPKTYECQLCKISHGWFGMHEQWRLGIEKLQLEPEYYHRDQLSARVTKKFNNLAFPCVLLQDDQNEINLLIDKPEITNCKDITQLLNLISQKVKNRM